MHRRKKAKNGRKSFNLRFYTVKQPSARISKTSCTHLTPHIGSLGGGLRRERLLTPHVGSLGGDLRRE